jgi:hypothetical protein
VAAKVQKGAETPIKITAQDDRFFSHIGGHEVAGIGHLAFMAKIEPTAREQTFAFQLVDLPIGKNAPVYETRFWIDKT